MPRAKQSANALDDRPNAKLLRYLTLMASNKKDIDPTLSNSFRKVASAVSKITECISNPLEIKHCQGMTHAVYASVETFFNDPFMMGDARDANDVEANVGNEIPSHESAATQPIPTLLHRQINRNYIPKYKSGAWAILIALLEAEMKNDGPLMLTKSQIIERAAPLSTASFTKPAVPSKIYMTAWEGMKTLEKHMLCQRLQRPWRFQLTTEGRTLAQLLMKADLTRRNISQSTATEPPQQDTIGDEAGHEEQEAELDDQDSQEDDKSSEVEYVSLGICSDYGTRFNTSPITRFQTTPASRRDMFKIILIENSGNLGPLCPESEALQKALRSKGFGYERRNTLIGDYLLVAQALYDYGEVKKGCEYVFHDVVKRDPLERFGDSIINKSIQEQKQFFRLVNFRKIYWIIEGDLEKIRSVSASSIRPKILNMILKDGIIVENVATPADTIFYLLHLAECLSDEWLSESADESPELMTYSELKAVCIQYQHNDIYTAFFWMLLMIPSIGPPEAVAVASVYPSYAELMTAYLHTQPTDRPFMLEKLFVHGMNSDATTAREMSERIYNSVFHE
eukprot:TRINITY_DN2341_c0_g1_i8.p1 TRINITY_DN2341_c0_g1~~TRINITY_DN2341_c0_g1_i8.p1  ORF type:complete len:567 (-),score=112.91 TRINITY_DN2341_c0_g1_i8:975-2675(-)